MQNPALAWATPTPALVATGLGALALAVAAAAAASDPVGRLLIGLAALGLAVITAMGLRQRPRLAVLDGAHGIAVTGILGRREYHRADLARIRIVRYPRLGRRVPMLEIDVRPAGADDDRLMIFGRWDLGTDPNDVFDALVVQQLVPPDPPRHD
ncbi:PH domain-containing protein [Rhodococcus kronopolitis]|uniref:PH domain-containing protein n=1 Tax=Rhodococcus kronopolitis TaxID=1460226 RepID=A0ABV9FX67_9NOCA